MHYYAEINGLMQRITEEQKKQIEAENAKLPFEQLDKMTFIFQMKSNEKEN